MKILVTGGCKNGKSLYAQKLINKVAGLDKKYYIATMMPYDEEDLDRIKKHQIEREGWGFLTLEQPRDIHQAADQCEKDSSVLLDSTTALLMNEMFLADGKINKKAYQKVIDGLILLSRKVKNIAIVSDYIYSDAELYSGLTEQYRWALAQIDLALAKELEMVCEVTLSNLIFHKRRSLF